MLKTKIVAMASCLVLVPAIAFADFVNGGFEDGSFNGWIVNDIADPFYPITVASNGSDNSFGWPWSSSPTEGNWAAYHGFDGDGVGAVTTISLAQDLVISGTTLEFDYRHAWDLTFGAIQDRTFEVSIQPSGGGPALETFTVVTASAGTTVVDTGNMSAALDVSAYNGQAVRVSFDWQIPEPFTGPGAAQLDNVRVTGTAIPEPTSMAILSIGLLALTKRRRK